MSTNTQAIPDDTRKAARSLAMYVFHHAVGSDDDSHSMDTDFATDAIAKAIHDAVMAERERCARIADDEASGRDWQRADANAQNDKRAARDFESMKIEAVQIASAIRAASKARG